MRLLHTRVAVISKSFEMIATEHEPIYGIDYSLEKISDEKLTEWKNAGRSDEISLPPPNEFIPEHFDVLPPASETVRDLRTCAAFFPYVTFTEKRYTFIDSKDRSFPIMVPSRCGTQTPQGLCFFRAVQVRSALCRKERVWYNTSDYGLRLAGHKCSTNHAAVTGTRHTIRRPSVGRLLQLVDRQLVDYNWSAFDSSTSKLQNYHVLS